MSTKAHPEDDAPNAKFLHSVNSETAATVGNPLFPSSGVITYRVMVVGPMGMAPVDVDAATGDDAAVMALAQYPGAKVANVTPAPRKAA